MLPQKEGRRTRTICSSSTFLSSWIKPWHSPPVAALGSSLVTRWLDYKQAREVLSLLPSCALAVASPERTRGCSAVFSAKYSDIRKGRLQERHGKYLLQPAAIIYREYWISWLPWDRDKIVTISDKSQYPITVKWPCDRSTAMKLPLHLGNGIHIRLNKKSNYPILSVSFHFIIRPTIWIG